MARRSPLHAGEDRPGYNRRVARVDPVFLALVLALLAVGLTMLYSASYAQSLHDSHGRTAALYVSKQALCALLGLVLMWVTGRLPAGFWHRWAWVIYGLGIGLLLLVLVAGSSVNGAKRWISIAGIRFQPSELTKFGLVVVFSRLTLRYGAEARRFRYGVVGFGGALMGILIPLALEKHLSAILLMGMVAVVMMFVAGTHPKWLLAGAAGAVLFVGVYITFMGYAGDRVSAWLSPRQDPGDTGYQILQSLYAIGSGGALGLGFGKSRQKYMYLPFQYNDYIFAVVCEEVGFLGAMVIILLFAALIIRGYWIALRAKDRFSTVLSAGFVTLIAVQTILNLCVVTNLLPSTGVALPFFSYGGTALAVNLAQMGVVLAVSRQNTNR